MKGSMKLLVVVLAAVMVSVWVSVSSGQTDQQASDEAIAEVIAANDSFYTALNAMFAGDAAPMEAVWSHADDVTYLPPTGERFHGWDAVLASWRIQADMKLGGEVKPLDVEAFLVEPTVALVTTTEVGQNTNAPNGPMTVNIRSSKVFRLEDGQWKLIYDHADLLPGLDAD